MPIPSMCYLISTCNAFNIFLYRPVSLFFMKSSPYQVETTMCKSKGSQLPYRCALTLLQQKFSPPNQTVNANTKF